MALYPVRLADLTRTQAKNRRPEMRKSEPGFPRVPIRGAAVDCVNWPVKVLNVLNCYTSMQWKSVMAARAFLAVIGLLALTHVPAQESVPSFEPSASAGEAEVKGSAHGASGYILACTQVLGFSQSMQWFAGFSLAAHAGEDGRPEPPPLKRGTFLPGWQGRFFLGGAVEHWTDPAYPGWSGPHDRAYETPAHCPPEEVDRVIFNVSGAARSPEEWAAAVESVAEVIRSKYPADPRIVMQPVVGAAEGMCRDIRAARNHPVIAEGIRMAAKQGIVEAGPAPKVASCSEFIDEFGHLTGDAARRIQERLRAHYREVAGDANE